MKDELLEQLMRDEGAVKNRDDLHIAYRCPAGKLTIGYGHNLDANPIPGISAISTLTERAARKLLADDIMAVCKQINERLPWAGKQLDNARYSVLVNMAFNLGLAGLLGFSETLRAVQKKDYANAAARMRVSLWAKQVGARARRLATQMEKGTWQ
ncbi:hypothetical protein FACS1894206_09940 [Deltaproteobacteria bacterium]|nr:hypothetical protein FACS1894206_09940 [Deltaproteobacteria bacterium]